MMTHTKEEEEIIDLCFLSEKEMELIHKYRNLTPEGKEFVKSLQKVVVVYTIHNIPIRRDK